MTNSRLLFNGKNSKKRHKFYAGSAIIETVVGIFVLMPIFLVLVDVIALVVGQTINDDIAKNTARYAASAANSTDAQAAAENYINAVCPYGLLAGGSGLVNSAQIVGGSINWDTTTTHVTTQVTINLPIAVPFLGIKQQTMQSQYTLPSIGVGAAPP